MSDDDNKAADQLANTRFKSQFDKLFRGAEADGLRKQAALDAEAGKALTAIERALARLAPPMISARRERLAKAAAENDRMRKFLGAASAEIAALKASVARFVEHRASATSAGRQAAREAAADILSKLEKIESALRETPGGREVLAKASRFPFVEMAPLDLERPMLRTTADRLESLWAAIFEDQRRAALAAASGIASKSASDDAAAAAIDQLNLDLAPGQVTELTNLLATVALDAAARTYGQVLDGGGADASEGLAPGADRLGDSVFADLALAARDWARAHAAELIDAVNETTRDDVREAIAEGLGAGAVVGGILASLTAFSEARAALIAETEVLTSNSEGALRGLGRAKDAGSELRKAWRTVPEPGGPCRVCIANEAAGALEIDEPFPSGDDAPPGHPNCRCLLVPLLRREADQPTRARRALH